MQTGSTWEQGNQPQPWAQAKDGLGCGELETSPAVAFLGLGMMAQTARAGGLLWDTTFSAPGLAASSLSLLGISLLIVPQTYLPSWASMEGAVR